MHKIIFEGIIDKDNIKHIRFSCNKLVTDIPIDDHVAMQITLSLGRIVSNGDAFKRHNDEPSI